MSRRHIFLLAAALLAGCSAPHRPAQTSPAELFHESAEETGLVFHHFNGATGQHRMPEIVGPGVALFDYDGDGDLDVFLVQGDFVDPGHSMGDAKLPLPPGWTPGCKLFRNELNPSGKLHFTDVTAESGIVCPGMGMGAAVGDYDNDGRPDLLVTGYGFVRLYHNNGNGTFTDVSREAGVQDTAWATSAAFVDYDLDGKLDLFVTHYVEYSNKPCQNAGAEPDYCAPENFRPTQSRLYHNEGGGRFRDVSAASGIASKRGPGLGVVTADLNGDGWPDIYVANDSAASHLWINQHNGTFVESGLETGTAYDINGSSQSGMGIAAGDFDNDGDEDLFKTNLTRQGANLYHNDGHGMFADAGAALGIFNATLPFTGFGAGWFDYDNDGWLDLAIANGAVYIIESERGQPFPYRQPSQVLHNDGGHSFRDVTREAGAALQRPEVSRGIAFGDIDNDGRTDFVIANNNGPTRLYLNRTRGAGHWLDVRLQGVRANREGIGAYVTVTLPDGLKLRRRVHTDGSYLSASDIRLHFGLGGATGVKTLKVEWPGGDAEEFPVPGIDRLVTFKQGKGHK